MPPTHTQIHTGPASLSIIGRLSSPEVKDHPLLCPILEVHSAQAYLDPLLFW